MASGLTEARLAVLRAYIVAVGAGAILITVRPDLSTWWGVVAADALATVIVFAFSRGYDNSSFYDPYWSVAPPIIVLYWLLWVPTPGASTARGACIAVLAVAWGVRLTWNWARGWRGTEHEDWRYADFRATTGRWYWLVSFAGIHAVPTLVVLLAMVPVHVAVVTGTNPFGLLDLLAVAVTAGAIGIETVADLQLHEFIRINNDPSRFLKTGLWGYCRHPNYFGEVSFWWGLWLFAVAADPSAWWTVYGPVAMTTLFLVVSIPLIDKRMVKKRPRYREQMKKVSRLIPWFPRDDGQ